MKTENKCAVCGGNLLSDEIKMCFECAADKSYAESNINRDLISRKAVVEMLKEKLKKNGHRSTVVPEKLLYSIIKSIQTMPGAGEAKK